MGIGYPSLAGMGAISSPRSLAGLAGMDISGDRGGDGGVSSGDPRPHRHFDIDVAKTTWSPPPPGRRGT
jgi:hypothetical protein